jgi:hypothetical protein
MPRQESRGGHRDDDPGTSVRGAARAPDQLLDCLAPAQASSPSSSRRRRNSRRSRRGTVSTRSQWATAVSTSLPSHSAHRSCFFFSQEGRSCGRSRRITAVRNRARAGRTSRRSAASARRRTERADQGRGLASLSAVQRRKSWRGRTRHALWTSMSRWPVHILSSWGLGSTDGRPTTDLCDSGRCQGS